MNQQKNRKLENRHFDMRTGHRFAKWGRLLLLPLVLSLTACDLFEERNLKWTEEVKFPDGRVVMLTRFQEFRDAGYDPGDYWFEFKDPDTGATVRWTSDRGISTLALFKHEGDVYLLLEFSYGSVTYRKYKCPNPPYILQRYRAGVWEQIDLKQIPLQKVAANMTYAIFDDHKKIRARGKHLTVSDTQNFEFQGKGVPFVVDFGLMKQQTFEGVGNNCTRGSDYLIAK